MTGLQKQVVPISLSQGIDTKTDPKQVVAGKLTLLENGIFKTAKEIRKRFGFDLISSNVQGAGAISSGVNIATYNNELIALDGQELYSYSESTLDWFDKGKLPTTSTALTSIIRNNYQQIQPDSAINGGIQVFAWNDSSNSGNVRYSVIDMSTGQSIINNAQVSPINSYVKVMAVGNFIVILYNSNGGGTNLYYKYIDISNPTVLSAEQTLATDFSASYSIFDCVVSNANLYIAYQTTSNDIGLYYLSPTLIKSTQHAVANALPMSAITVFTDASFNIWLSWGNSASTNLYIAILDNTLTTVILPKTLAITSGISIVNITGTVVSGTATILYSFGTQNTPTQYSSTFTNQTKYITATTSGPVILGALIAFGLSLSSKAFSYNGMVYALYTFVTQEQATYFIVNGAGLAVAKFLPGNGGGVNVGYLPEANVISSGVFQFAARVRDRLVAFQNNTSAAASASSNQFTQTGIESLQITFTTKARSKITIGNNLMLSGGLLWMYDGAYPVEHGYNMYPEGISAAFLAAVGGGGGIGIGFSTSSVNQLQYSAIYEWTDNQGQLHRSATAVPFTILPPDVVRVNFSGVFTIGSQTVTSIVNIGDLVVGQSLEPVATIGPNTYVVSIDVAGTSMVMSTKATLSMANPFSSKDSRTVRVSIPTLRLTAKKVVVINIYRTVNNGTIFYRVTSPKKPLFNDSTVDVITYDDMIPDQVIIGNEQLYTTGGEVDNIAAPSVSALATYKNRAIYLSPENPNAFGYSKQVISGFPVEFNSQLFVQTIDPKGGDLTAIAEMDDKLILFKKTYLFYVAGTGPTPSGLNNDFQDPQVISTDTGCDDPRSIILTPVGLMFRSPKGIYLLNRGLSMSYIGADVEQYNNIAITSARMEENLNQVRFTLDSGIALVFDYYFNQWAVFTGINAADATSYKNRYTYISPAGVVMKENFNVFTDNLAFIKLKIQTAWFSFSGLQGFERIYQMLILGDYKSPHTLNISVAFDFKASVVLITPIPVLTDPGVYQYRINLPQQKCETFQFILEDSQVASYGEGLSLSSMALLLGMKQGLNKMSAAKSYG